MLSWILQIQNLILPSTAKKYFYNREFHTQHTQEQM